MDDVIVADIDRRVRTAVEDDDIARLHVGRIDRITGRCLCRRPRNVDARHAVSQLCTKPEQSSPLIVLPPSTYGVPLFMIAYAFATTSPLAANV